MNTWEETRLTKGEREQWWLPGQIATAQHKKLADKVMPLADKALACLEDCTPAWALKDMKELAAMVAAWKEERSEHA